MIAGFRCAACVAFVDISTVHPWRCPGASADDHHHVLRLVRSLAPMELRNDSNPFVAFDSELAWSAFAAAHGMSQRDRIGLVRELDAAVAAVAGTGFRRTPFVRHAALSDHFAMTDHGGVWVKDETHNVAGSHKARHLFSTLLHLRAAEELGLVPPTRPTLAIASCGNAAIAAATLAAAAHWPIDVFVPVDAAAAVVAKLDELGASVIACPRRAADPPGDPCIHRFRAAVANGAIPFSVQGPENALCLDGGRTIGWEMTDLLGHLLDRVFVQIGGGALLTAVADAASVSGVHAQLVAVQTEGCAPFVRAWRLCGEIATDSLASQWSTCMWPWETEPRSAADGILDDETYDWVGAVEGLRRNAGQAVVVPEAAIVEAHRLAGALTSIDASATGTAGLAGLIDRRADIADDERVAVIFSGVRRAAP